MPTFTLLIWYEVRRQHVKALQAAAISPYLTSQWYKQGQTTTLITSCPTFPLSGRTERKQHQERWRKSTRITWSICCRLNLISGQNDFNLGWFVISLYLVFIIIKKDKEITNQPRLKSFWPEIKLICDIYICNQANIRGWHNHKMGQLSWYVNISFFPQLW